MCTEKVGKEISFQNLPLLSLLFSWKDRKVSFKLPESELQSIPAQRAKRNTLGCTGKCRTLGTAGTQAEICFAVLTHGVGSAKVTGEEQSVCNDLGMPFSASHLENDIINTEVTFCFSSLLANSHFSPFVLLALLCIISLTPQRRTKRKNKT